MTNRNASQVACRAQCDSRKQTVRARMIRMHVDANIHERRAVDKRSSRHADASHTKAANVVSGDMKMCLSGVNGSE